MKSTTTTKCTSIPEVTLLQDELVPAASSLPTQTYIETSIVMRRLMKLTNLDFTYIFEGRPDLEKLKISLQQILVHYPQFAGRLDGNRMHLSNQGAAFRLQESTFSSIQDISDEPLTGPPYCYIPTPLHQVQGQAPLLTVTVTIFTDGWTLGVVANHVLADAATFAMFMKDWSEMYNTGKCETISYQLPKSFLATSEDLDADAEEMGLIKSSRIKNLVMKFLLQVVIPQTMSRTDSRNGTTPQRMMLHYTKEELKQIKLKAEQNSNTWISTNEALLAHVWDLFLDATGVTREQRSQLGVAVAIDLRNKLPGLSGRVAGNAVTATAMPMDMAAKDRVEQLHHALRAKLAPEKLSVMHRVGNTFWDETTPFQFLEQKTGDVVYGGNPGALQWNWQATNPYYEIDFGTGPPLRGIPWCWNQPIPCATVLPSPDGDGGGVDVYVDMTDKGLVTWANERTTRWSTISLLCALLACVGSVVLSKLGAGRDIAALWLAIFMLLASVATNWAQQETTKAKRAIQDYCQEHRADL